MLEHVISSTILSGIMIFNVINLAALHTWLERKQSAVMQDRIGANRAHIGPFRLLGLFHPLADAIKMFFKEDFVPPSGHRVLHTLAPFLSMVFALITFAAIPFGDVLRIGDMEIGLQPANLNIGVLYILAMLSMVVYGVVLAGYSSNNNYAFLGGLRASAQMISYEVTLGLTIMGLVMIYGTLNLQEMIRWQGRLLFGFLPAWGVFMQPLGFLLFLAAGIAETKRIPYDIPEAESEIIGYFTEYSGMKFGMYFFTDYVETILLACMSTALFFGGWQVPFLRSGGFHWGGTLVLGLPHLLVTLMQIGSFTAKVLAFCWFFMLIRWTLPRFRYDQLMKVGWKMMLPLSLANLLATAVILVMVGN
ncbi:MAG: NADH-quinone oxidoreductase subunit H [Candidatus Omnitrophica bacterium]|nr:NADH-quinone oxidoreductase subunit H [Candidatus Omnitrophota bacterium]